MMWEKADWSNIDELTDMFWQNISENLQYISHGEIQMGVAESPGVLARDGKEKWKIYIKQKIENDSGDQLSAVFVYKQAGVIEAFCVLEILEDHHRPFGMICDMLVKQGLRGKGIGGEMFNVILEWFGKYGVTDIYLESGIENHSAHEFFCSKGFFPVSQIFRLSK